MIMNQQLFDFESAPSTDGQLQDRRCSTALMESDGGLSPVFSEDLDLEDMNALLPSSPADHGGLGFLPMPDATATSVWFGGCCVRTYSRPSDTGCESNDCGVGPVEDFSDDDAECKSFDGPAHGVILLNHLIENFFGADRCSGEASVAEACDRLGKRAGACAAAGQLRRLLERLGGAEDEDEKSGGNGSVGILPSMCQLSPLHRPGLLLLLKWLGRVSQKPHDSDTPAEFEVGADAPTVDAAAANLGRLCFKRQADDSAGDDNISHRDSEQDCAPIKRQRVLAPA